MQRKKMLRKWFVLTAGLALLVAAALPAAAQSADPIQVAKAYVAAANSGNFDQALAFYADNAVVRNPLGLFVGKDQIAGWLQNDVKTTRATAESYQANGSTVISTGQVTLDRFEKIGSDKVAYRSEYLIENGKIRFFEPTVTLTPEQQAIAQARLPAPPPAPGDPAQVVKDYISAANSGDFARAFAFYADDAVVRNPLGLFVGKDQIGQWLRSDVQTTRATPAAFQVSGNTVINTGQVSLDRFTRLGIDRVNYRAEYLIEGGKIRFFEPTVQLTAEQQAQVAAASPGASAPQATGDSAPNTLPVTGGSWDPLQAIIGTLVAAARAVWNALSFGR